MKTKSQYYFDMAKKSDVPPEIARYMRLGFEALKKGDVEMSENIIQRYEHERSAAVIERRRIEKELEETTAINRKLTDRHIKEINKLKFCFDELLGELGWGDEIEETGVDPLVWARGEIKRLQNREKSLQLRDAANGKCKKCGTLHGKTIIHCDVCGAFQ